MKKNIIPGVPNQKGSVWRMQQKFFHWAMVMAVAAAVACTGCSQNRTTDSGTAESAVTQVTESAEDQTETSGISGQALSSVQSGTMGVTTDTEDETDTYDSFDAEITLKDEDTKVKGNTKAVTVDGNQVTITAGGTYSITGSLTDGQLLVTGSEKVKLYCNGMQIANSSGPALVCLNEKRTILSLAKDTENRLEDGSGYSEEEISGKNVSPGALYVQDKLTINGTGSLTINGNCADGIVCKDVLKLMDGTITVQAKENGIKSKECVALFGGDVAVTAGNDGVKATETGDVTKGFLQFENGSLSVQSGGDCLQAESLVWITDGDYSLTSLGTAEDAETGDSVSAKGIHCAGDMELGGGILTIDAPEDGIHCGGTFQMEYGTLTITSGEDGVQADGDLLQSGGQMNITTTGTVADSSKEEFSGGMAPGGDGSAPADFSGGTPPEMPSGEAPSGNPPARPDGSNSSENGTAPTGNPPEKPDGTQPASPENNMTADNSVTTAAQTAAQPAETKETTTTAVSDTQTDTAADASSKGIKCGGNLTMSGGSCTVNATDHAVHASGTAEFSGTDLDLTSDNKGISAHGNLTVSDGNITIQRCTEGIESKAEMEIAGGKIRILGASNDGLNTGGNEGSHAMTISGGYTYICADGDGVDSNSTWTMTGGTLLVCGSTSGGDGSLDANGTMTYSGGTLLALSSKGMMEYPENGCLVATNCSAAAGDTISIVDDDGNVLVSLISPKAVSDVIYGIGDGDASSYQIVTGGTLSGSTPNADGYAEGGTLTGGTSVTANGGSGSQFGGGNPGGSQPGGGPGGAPNGMAPGQDAENPNENSSDSAGTAA